MDYHLIPKNMRKEDLMRKPNLPISGKPEIYHYSPGIPKPYTKPSIIKYMGNGVEPPVPQVQRSVGSAKPAPSKKMKPSSGRILHFTRNPVTVVKSQPGSKTRHDIKHGTSQKPHQVFWQKRLEGMKATNADSDFCENFDLPKNIKSVGTYIANDTALRSVVTALHLHQGPVIGQTAGRNVLEKNPGVFLDPKQPLVGTIIISNDDVRRQEERVHLLRRKLALALQEYEKR